MPRYLQWTEEKFTFGACRNTTKNVCTTDDCLHFVYRQDSSFLVRWLFTNTSKSLVEGLSKSVKFWNLRWIMVSLVSRFSFVSSFLSYLSIEHFFHVCIASSKHEEGWENSRQLYKPERSFCITSENSPNPRLFRWGYVTMEKVLYCFHKIILKNTRESKTSQPCLHTLT